MYITEIIQAVIALIAAIVSAFVIPWLKSKTTAEQRAELEAWVKIAVAAAEQLYDSTDCKGKKEYVLEFLAQKGWYLNADEVDASIEAAVLKLHAEIGK